MRLIPNFRGFDFFPHDTRLPFMRYKGLCFGLSVAAMLISLGFFLIALAGQLGSVATRSFVPLPRPISTSA